MKRTFLFRRKDIPLFFRGTHMSHHASEFFSVKTSPPSPRRSWFDWSPHANTVRCSIPLSAVAFSLASFSSRWKQESILFDSVFSPMPLFYLRSDPGLGFRDRARLTAATRPLLKYFSLPASEVWDAGAYSPGLIFRARTSRGFGSNFSSSIPKRDLPFPSSFCPRRFFGRLQMVALRRRQSSSVLPPPTQKNHPKISLKQYGGKFSFPSRASLQASSFLVSILAQGQNFSLYSFLNFPLNAFNDFIRHGRKEVFPFFRLTSFPSFVHVSRIDLPSFFQEGFPPRHSSRPYFRFARRQHFLIDSSSPFTSLPWSVYEVLLFSFFLRILSSFRLESVQELDLTRPPPLCPRFFPLR